MPSQLPLLPLILDDVPTGLVRALAQEGIPFRHNIVNRNDADTERAAGRFVLYDSRRRQNGFIAAGQKLIDVDKLRQPPYSNLTAGVDPFDALVDTKSAQMQWKIGGISVCEEIARFDKREIRRELMARLRRTIEEHGGLWLRVAAFPFPYRSAFNFRIDYDQFQPQDFNATLDAVASHASYTSHFVNAAAYLDSGDAWQRFQGLDVGSHGYRHHTYRSEEENLRNISLGIETIRSHGIAASGFAAPMGRFYPGLLAALEKLGVSHSSEFGLVYDELPFIFGESTLVQIPVHPICLGLFLDAAHSSSKNTATNDDALSPSDKARIRSAVNAATVHLVETARRRYRCGEPVFLYGHPTGRLGLHPQLLTEIFRTVDEFAAIWKTTMSEFANWWRVRSTVCLSVSRHGDKFAVSAGELPREYRLGIEYFRGRHVALLPLEKNNIRFSPGSLAYENRESRREFRPVRVDRPHGIKGHIRRLIDWERVTPVEEIAATSWQNIAKRTLRRWWRP